MCLRGRSLQGCSQALLLVSRLLPNLGILVQASWVPRGATYPGQGWHRIRGVRRRVSVKVSHGSAAELQDHPDASHANLVCEKVGSVARFFLSVPAGGTWQFGRSQCDLCCRNSRGELFLARFQRPPFLLVARDAWPYRVMQLQQEQQLVFPSARMSIANGLESPYYFDSATYAVEHHLCDHNVVLPLSNMVRL